MKTNCFDHNRIGLAEGKPAGTTLRKIEEIDLFVEEREDVIVPRLAANHNETMVIDDEDAIALRLAANPETKKRGKEADVRDRRKFLKAAGAGLVAASVPSVAAAALKGTQKGDDGESNTRPKPVYLSGCGWNRALPGVFGEVCLTFDMRAELGGTGVGTFRDDVHPEINSQFQINSATRRHDEYTFEGEIIASRDPAMVGRPVTIVAEAFGDGTGSATITLGTAGTHPNLVVIAIIAVLIALLVPAVQKVR